MQYRRALVWSLTLVGLAAACDRGSDPAPEAYPRDDTLRLNEIQVLATHNSYHLRPDPALPDPLMRDSDYAHAPLAEQLDEQGVRSVELDVYNGDGFPVQHTPVIDDDSTCDRLGECLGVVEEWSDAHPGHVPIFVLIEPKEQTVPLDPGLGTFDTAGLAGLDETVRSVFDDDDLVTPDAVRGRAPGLRAAVLGSGWPTLGETRGKVVVVLFVSGETRSRYLTERPALEGAPMLVTTEEDDPSAAVVRVDEPDEATIARLVEAGFIVRTEADARLAEPRAGDVRRRDLALRSGAQLVVTDFPVPDAAINPEYSVRIPDGTPARCNPVLAPRDCRPSDVENPRHLSRGVDDSDS